MAGSTDSTAATLAVVMLAAFLVVPACGRTRSDSPASDASGSGGPPAAEADHRDHDHDEANHDAAGVLAIDEKTRQVLGIRTAPAAEATFDEEIAATGRIINNENNEAHVSSLVPGRVNALEADWGERVKAGQTLVCIESPEIGRRRADYSRAEAELSLARQEFGRKERLLKQDAVSARQLIQAETDLKSAEIAFEHARRMLLLTGLAEANLVDGPDDHPTPAGSTVHLAAPIGGIVIDRAVRLGEYVQPGTCLYKVLDPSSVWIRVDVFEKDLPRVHRGGRISVTVPAYPDRAFAGTVIHVGAVLDEETRTVQVRSQVANADLALKPGMFANVRLALGTQVSALGVPEAAVLVDGEGAFVFVQEGAVFHRHDVRTGARTGGRVQILSGLAPGALVVIQGQHQLKSRQAMRGIDPHAGHAH